MKRAAIILFIISLLTALVVLYWEYFLVETTKTEPVGLIVAMGAFYTCLVFLFLFGAYRLVEECKKID